MKRHLMQSINLRRTIWNEGTLIRLILFILTTDTGTGTYQCPTIRWDKISQMVVIAGPDPIRFSIYCRIRLYLKSMKENECCCGAFIVRLSYSTKFKLASNPLLRSIKTKKITTKLQS